MCIPGPSTSSRRARNARRSALTRAGTIGVASAAGATAGAATAGVATADASVAAGFAAAAVVEQLQPVAPGALARGTRRMLVFGSDQPSACTITTSSARDGKTKL